MADEPQPGEKPKLIIDEDWKRQAQAEKEALAMKAQAEAAGGKTAPGGPGPAAPPGDEAGAATEYEPLPPASLPVLFSTLTTQALVALGQIAHPLTGKAELDLEHAKHQIDMLAVLQDKTKGNCTPDESQMLNDLLHDLRMTFVAVRQHVARQSPPA